VEELTKKNELLEETVSSLQLKLGVASAALEKLQNKQNEVAELKKQMKRYMENEKVVAKRQKLDDIVSQEVPVLEEIVMRTQNRGNAPYSDLLKEFSYQLHYYSPRAYNYLRDSLHPTLKLLPHPMTLNGWTSHIPATPGMQQCSLDFLRTNVAKSEYPIYYALSVDEVYIRKGIIHHGNGFIGFIDYGDILQTPDKDKEATTALFVMATAINSTHRVPVAYILTNGLTADTLAAVIRKVLLELGSINARVLTLTFDGLGSNMKAVEKLGANLDVCSTEFRPFILHPQTKEKIHVILDAVHMFKLLRNHWNKNKVIFDGDEKVPNLPKVIFL